MLTAWLLGAAMCTLLDEALAVLVTLWTAARPGPGVAAPALIAFSLGSVVGAAIVQRALLRVTARTAVLVSASVCVVALGGWLTSPSSSPGRSWVGASSWDAAAAPLSSAREGGGVLDDAVAPRVS